MKKVLSLFLAFVMLFSTAAATASFSYASSKMFAQDRLEEIQKTKGYIPDKTAVVQGNCYGFVSKVCEKLYGVKYDGEGLYGNYRARHETGNYYTVSTLTAGSANSENIEKVITFFIKYAAPGDVIHYGKQTSGTKNTSTHTVMVQSIDSEKMQVYHANYETVDHPRSSCHIDTIYWKEWRKNHNENTYDSNGHLYSINRMFATKMNNGGIGITVNRYTNYEKKYYLFGAAVPELTSSRYSSTGIKLEWDKIKNADKYQIQYKKSKDSSYKTASSSCKSLSYTMDGLTTGEKYDFRVRASISGVWMDYSDVHTKQVLPPTIADIKFQPAKDGLKIKWAKRSDITGVRIYKSTSKGGKYKLIKTQTDLSVTSYVDKDIEYGENTYYKFERYIKSGGREYSTTSNVKTGKYSLKTPEITAYNIKYDTIRFSCDGDNAQECYVYSLRDSGGKYICREASAKENELEFDNLTVGEEYTFSCAEKNDFGKGKYAEIKCKALPSAQKSVSAKAVSNGIKISYGKSDDADGYYIYRSTSKNGKYTKLAQVDEQNVQTFTDKTVKYNTSYYYKVKNYVTQNRKDYLGAASSASNSAKVSLSKPENVTVTRKTPTSVTVKWNKSSNATRYVVEYKNMSTKKVKTKTVASNSVVIASLPLGITYSFTVKASNAVGSSSKSSAVSKKILPPTPPAPKAARVSRGIKVSWTPKDYATGYKVYRSTSKNGTYTLIKTVSNNTTKSVTDIHVKKNKGYYYKIVCYKKSGKKEYLSPKSKYTYIKY